MVEATKCEFCGKISYTASPFANLPCPYCNRKGKDISIIRQQRVDVVESSLKIKKR